MSELDVVLPLVLVLSVVRQLRGKRLTLWQLTWPIALVVWATWRYVRGFPDRATDVALVVGCALTGVSLGVLAARFTRVCRTSDGTVTARAGTATVAFWTIGAIGRLVFGLCAEHGGGPAIARFDAAHGLVAGAWAAALTLMALAEVLGRTAVLVPRAYAAAHATG